MYEAKIIITSDEITPWKLFLLMREVEKEHPHLSGLSEKIVILLEKEDFQELMNPRKPDEIVQGQFNQKDNALDVLCKLLKPWGNCSEEVV